MASPGAWFVMPHRDTASISSSCGRGGAINRALAQGLSDQLPASSLTTAQFRSSFYDEIDDRRACGLDLGFLNWVPHGERLLENIDHPKLIPVEVVGSPSVNHSRYRFKYTT